MSSYFGNLNRKKIVIALWLKELLCFAQAYVKFKGISVKISTNGNPFHSPTGFLPYIKDDNEKVAGYDEIIAYFHSKVSHQIISNSNVDQKIQLKRKLFKENRFQFI